ncbi:MAG: alanine dehydrogenase [Bacteroidetes bacterium]|nr:alanine dehydrogenase [Bacteroidota bacterium]
MLAEQDNIIRMSQSGKLMPKEEILEVTRRKSCLKIGVPREISSHEHRIALVPQAVGLLAANGHVVLVESGAGDAAYFSDNKFSESGAHIVYSPQEVYDADIIIKVSPPLSEEIELLKPKQTLFSALHLAGQTEIFFRKLINKKMTALAYEYIKDKADSYSLRRSMSEIVGSTVVLIAAEYLSKPGFGKGCLLGGITGITPTEIVILGAGTVGEYAVRAALGLGATVKVFDNSIYKLRRLQNSINTRIFTSIIQPKVLLDALKTADVVIGAIHSCETQAPVIITEDMVRQMSYGSVIIDVSIDQGGCIETSQVTSHANPVFRKWDITHYCVPNIASRVPHTASYALSNFLAPMLLKLGEEGGIDNLLRSDKGLRHGVYLFNGTITKMMISNTFALPYQDIELLMAAYH